MPEINENAPEDVATPRDSKLSRQSQKWDTNNKGFLSKSERLVKEVDKDGKGYLNQEEARALGSKINELSEENSKIRKILCFVIVLVILLCGATITATYFAIVENQQTVVDENGRLASADGGAEVAVKAQGVKVFTYQMEGTNRTKTCVTTDDLAIAWNENENGGVATFVVQNAAGDQQVLRLSPTDARMTQELVSFGDLELYPDPECNPSGDASSTPEDANRRLREHVRSLQLGFPFFGNGGGALSFALSDSDLC